ncbi:MAG: hypothetical protein IKT41_01410 [Clostridia bacterium]|nr:hypothetical protein [Clostridia bacterium]
MNLQTIAVIFAIIVIPISLVLSAYIGTHIDTLVYQSQYDTKLAEATYDAVKAFQLNTLNNQYSTISDSKIRDIEASVNVFFDSLGTNLGWGSYNENQVKEHVPALVYTLYDGYYIYSKYDNIGDGNSNYTRNNQYGLKPYIYYTCRYKNDSTDSDFVINYTLDNAIIVYGKINGTYYTKSGYFVNQTKLNNTLSDTTDILNENILIFNSTKTAYKVVNYNYFYNEDNIKVYINNSASDDESLDGFSGDYYFLYRDNKRVGLGTASKNSIKNDNTTEGKEKSAQKYKDESNDFSTIIGEIANSKAEAWDTNAKIDAFDGITTEDIFNISQDPESPSSDFNEHKRAVIQRSIKSNLYTAMANFSKSSTSSYEFRMPEIDETEWDKVVGNVGVIAFMQGIPMGNKYYNDYCIVSNNNNKEFVSEDSIYIIATDTSGREEYHRVGCNKLQETGVVFGQAYLNIDFRRQTVKVDENTNYYYYPQEAQACYDCIVSQNGVNSEIINNTGFKGTDLGKIFYRALAREKYNLYKVNDYLNDT